MAKTAAVLALALSAGFFAWCIRGIARSDRKKAWFPWLLLRLPRRRRRGYNK